MPKPAILAAEPLISIAMSARNAERTITLSIRSILRQSYQNWELVLIDDGSTDSTLERIRAQQDPRIRLIADGLHKGLAARLNQAIQAAKGKYIARMDADDVSCAERLAKQVNYLEANPNVDLLGSGAFVFNDAGQPLGNFPVRETHAEICASPWSGFLLAHPTWMGKREWFLKYGYRDEARRAQDQDLLLRAHRDSHYACLNENLVGYRQAIVSAWNILTGRYYYSLALWRYALKHREASMALRGVSTQLCRALIAVFIVSLVGARHLVERRFKKVDDSQLKAWQDCWSSLANGE